LFPADKAIGWQGIYKKIFKISGENAKWLKENKALKVSGPKGSTLEERFLIGANLKDMNLSGANLGRAILNYANLAGADLANANLSGADFTNANLTNVNLTNADMKFRTYFSGADLSGAYFLDSGNKKPVTLAWLNENGGKWGKNNPPKGI